MHATETFLRIKLVSCPLVVFPATSVHDRCLDPRTFSADPQCLYFLIGKLHSTQSRVHCSYASFFKLGSKQSKLGVCLWNLFTRTHYQKCCIPQSYPFLFFPTLLFRWLLKLNFYVALMFGQAINCLILSLETLCLWVRTQVSCRFFPILWTTA